MNVHYLISSKIRSPPLQRFHLQDTDRVDSRIGCSFGYPQRSHSGKISEARNRKIVAVRLDDPAKISRKKGSVAGAAALIIGTSIGSGILALPKRTSPAGLVPSSITMTICWAFLLLEALLLAEINVGLQKQNKKSKAVRTDDALQVISIRTMAQETLGEWGGNLATLTYVFLGYTSMVAYCSKSGDILHHLTDFPVSVSGVIFTSFFTALISVGGTRATDQVNRWLTASMIALLVSIEVLAVVFGGWTGFDGSGGNWEKVPATLPVMIFTLVYHDLTPVLCAYLDGDLKRIRASIFLGSVVPLLTLLVWEAIALGLSNQADQVSDPLDLLLSVRWDGVPFMVEAFSLLAVGTSLIGTLLSFSEFFKEQLNALSLDLRSARNLEKPSSFDSVNSWWEKHRTSIAATAMVVAPSLVVSTTIPDAFYAATDISGGYCMTMLYGVLPPAMAWAMNKKKEGQGSAETAISKAGPALVGVGLFASAIVVEQIFQDFSFLHP